MFEWCAKCQQNMGVVDEGTSVGFSGAPIYHVELACGHYNVDDGQDNLGWVR